MKYDIQRAGMGKRFGAWFLDAFLFISLAVLIISLLSEMVHLGDHTVKLDNIYAEYEEKYGISFYMTQEDWDKMSEEEKLIMNHAATMLAQDMEAKQTYEMVLNLILLTLSLGLLIPYLILEIAVPLLFKNGQTLGKKALGLAVMRTDSVKISPFLLFVRTVLGKYTVETMIPVAFLVMSVFGLVNINGLLFLTLFLTLQLGIMGFTRNRSTIHDLLSHTVVVEYSSQMIFDCPEARDAYEARINEN